MPFDGADGCCIYAVPPSKLEAFLPELRPYLERMAAGSRGRYETQDIIEAICAGRHQLWIVRGGAPGIRAAGLTEIMQYPRARAVRFTACVGIGWRDWKHLQNVVRAWAQDYAGCDFVEVIAPPKWRHLFPDLRASHVLFEGSL